MSNTTSQPPAQQTGADAQQPMSLEEARCVIWQTQPKEPMGQLLDRGKLTRGDLEWAVRKAYRADVRRAAQRLLQELDQPTSPVAITTDLPRYGPRVIVASDYLEDQETFHGWLLAYYVGLSVGVLILTVNTFLWLLRGHALWITAVSIGANVAAWAWLVGVARRQIRRVRSFRMGRKGEEQVVEQLRTSLDHRWTVYRNLQLPDRKDDLDLILVGPGGVWVVQIKAFSVPLRFHAGAWEYRRGHRWVRCDAKHDPATQVTRQATLLNDFFKRHGIQRFVERIIALVEPLPFDQVEGSEIPVWLPFNVAEHAAALTTRYPPSDDELARINDLLRTRAVEQRAEERARRR